MLLPFGRSLQHVRDAARLMGEKGFDEANLALKAAGVSLIDETYDVDAIPVQGHKS